MIQTRGLSPLSSEETEAGSLRYDYYIAAAILKSRLQCYFRLAEDKIFGYNSRIPVAENSILGEYNNRARD